MLTVNDFKFRQIVFVFSNRGDSIAFRNDNIIVKDSAGVVVFQTTCYQLFILYIIGNASITSAVLDRSKKFGFSVVFMSENFRTYCSFQCKTEGNVILRKKQYANSGFDLGKWVIVNKIDNQISALSSIRGKTKDQTEALDVLKTNCQKLKESGPLDFRAIMGVEGTSSRVYFKAMFGEKWIARCPRTKIDPFNCLLDIGYNMLFNLVSSLLEMYGFDVYMGILHRPFFHRKSLACDLVEPFRPIVDKAIRKASNLGMIKYDDFYVDQNQYFLFGKKAIPYMRFLTKSIMDYKEDMYRYIQAFYRAFVRGLPAEEFPVFKVGI